MNLSGTTVKRVLELLFADTHNSSTGSWGSFSAEETNDAVSENRSLFNMAIHITPDFKVWFFDYVWRACASAGLVDSLGSAEYRRQKQTWHDKGMPVDPLPLEVKGHITPDGFAFEGTTDYISLFRLH